MRAKDLGLLIVDEEQRFGVKQKELLRQLKLRVDVISMSATPIPRTLQMSMAGVRDISVIETPPEGRRPVKTYVGEYDEELVRRALLREKERHGQAFFLHNRVETIEETAVRLRGLCPGHALRGRPRPDGRAPLEKRMLRFLRGDADVLVCTSIIESGIDIPQANTLIVERADVFGLSQLYQIRGRVGRSRERAYAYLLYPSAAALTPGGGAAAVGAVATTPSWAPASRSRCGTWSCAGPATCSATSSPGTSPRSGSSCTCRCSTRRSADVRGRRAAPRRTGSRCGSTSTSTPTCRPTTSPTSRPRSTCTAGSPASREVADLVALREELEDRFGEMPDPLRNLIALQQARIKLGQAGARAVTVRGDRLAVTPIELDSVRAKKIRAQIPEALYESGKSQLSVRVPKDPAQRFPAIVRAADVLLSVTREAEDRSPPRRRRSGWGH